MMWNRRVLVVSVLSPFKIVLFRLQSHQRGAFLSRSCTLAHHVLVVSKREKYRVQLPPRTRQINNAVAGSPRLRLMHVTVGIGCQRAL